MITEVKTLDATKYRNAFKNRILYGYDLESHIIKNYSSNRVKQATLYNECVAMALDHLVGIQNKKDPIQLFELIKEDDFNTRFMEIIDWLEHKSCKLFDPFFTTVYVSKVIDTEDKFCIEFTYVKEL